MVDKAWKQIPSVRSHLRLPTRSCSSTRTFLISAPSALWFPAPPNATWYHLHTQSAGTLGCCTTGYRFTTFPKQFNHYIHEASRYEGKSGKVFLNSTSVIAIGREGWYNTCGLSFMANTLYCDGGSTHPCLSSSQANMNVIFLSLLLPYLHAYFYLASFPRAGECRKRGMSMQL